MRYLRIRAWDKHEKKMINFKEILDVEHHSLIIDEKGNFQYYNLQNGSGGTEYILMQYTGLKDKCGNEIYEGDIIHTTGHFEGVGFYDTGEHDYDFKSVVSWDEDYLAYKCKTYLLSELSSVEIIGNIFENHNLIEE